MPQVIPLLPVASQTLAVQLNGQPASLAIYQAGQSTAPVYMDLAVNDAPIIGGVICQQANVIVRDAYLGFSGDLVFYDTQPDPVLGPQDPQPAGLGTRWILVYLLPGELPAGIA